MKTALCVKKFSRVAMLMAALGSTLVVYPNTGWSRGFEQVVRCESRDFQQSFCPANTRGGVRLVNQRSRSSCIEGQSWTFDRRGIYVREGCAADFQTGASSPFYDGSFEEGRSQKRESNTGAVIAGAAIGVGILWALSNAGKSGAQKSSAEKKQTQGDSATPSAGGWRNPDEVSVSFDYNKLNTQQRQAVDRCFERTRQDAMANGAQNVERLGIDAINEIGKGHFQVSLNVQGRFGSENRLRTAVCDVSPTTVASYQLR